MNAAKKDIFNKACQDHINNPYTLPPLIQNIFKFYKSHKTISEEFNIFCYHDIAHIEQHTFKRIVNNNKEIFVYHSQLVHNKDNQVGVMTIIQHYLVSTKTATMMIFWNCKEKGGYLPLACQWLKWNENKWLPTNFIGSNEVVYSYKFLPKKLRKLFPIAKRKEVDYS